MKTTNRGSLISILIAVIVAAGSAGCGGGLASTPPPPSPPAISVKLSPSGAQSVAQGQTVNFTASVANDSSGRGVTWSVSGAGCAGAACGTLSNVTTTSATYTAPSTVAANLPVIVTATSAADSTKSAPGSITVLALTVTVLPATAQPVAQGQTVSFTATVANDSSNKGVAWTVSCSTAPCGTVSPAATASGAPTTYTAPGSVSGNLSVTVTATSVADPTKVASGVSVTVLGITVSVAPMTATLSVGATAQLTANILNDPANGGVTWSVSCSVAPCGMVSSTATASGAATTYTAPVSPPAGLLTVTITAASVTVPAATASATITISGITVSIAPSSATVGSGGTQPFTATVTNDPSNGGVTWSLQFATVSTTTVCDHRICFSCSPGSRCVRVVTVTVYHPCGSQCGSVSPSPTASGAPTTYTAPNTPPSLLGPYLVATSVTNPGAFIRARIGVLPISVVVSPPSASVVVNATQQFTATVTNEGANSGVAWTLTQNGAACSPGCGTIAPTSTASAAPVTYTAPATVPAFPLVTLAATPVTDPSRAESVTITVTTASGAACGAGSGSESLLKGQYAFMLLGTDRSGVVVLAGSFTADGSGKITAGEEDSNASDPIVEQSGTSIDATRSSYAVGPDHRGCLTLALTPNGLTRFYRFALGSTNSGNIATKGHIIEFDDTDGSGRRLAGTLKLQDATSFSASQFKGSYAVGMSGSDGLGLRLAIAGTLTSDGVSVITATDLDINDAGTVGSNVSSTSGGSFTCCSTNGRGTLQITAGSFASSLAVYMISSSDAFVVNHGPGQYSGEAIGIPTGTTFTQASLNGAAVLRKTAQSIVVIAIASANGTTGILMVTDNENNAGTFTTMSTPLNYVVAANGRVTLTGGSTPPVLYLYGQNQGFLVGTNPEVDFGILESQAAGPFSNASLSGAFMFGTENPSASSVTLESGVAALDGAGNVAGTFDQSNSAGLTQNQSLSLTYSVSATGTGTFGSGTTAILVSGNKLVFINNTSTTPTITVVEK